MRCHCGKTVEHTFDIECAECFKKGTRVETRIGYNPLLPMSAIHNVGGPVREFDTGATRSPDANRDDPEGFLSPLVIDRFCAYMSKHRTQVDGSLRSSDNWQKGMPKDSYMKGGWRHFLHWWTRHRGWPVRDPGAAADVEEDLCALLFNVQGYLHEVLKAKGV